MPALEVLFTPAEFMALRERDLSGTVCVVFDVLRATSSMLTALGNGAAQIIPVSEIEEALALYHANPAVLLAGERDGVRIRAAQTGGKDFDLGNSPREFRTEVVRGRTIVMTTTNGTRALRACASARATLVGAFLNLGAVEDWLRRNSAPDLLLICAGTFDQASYEDTLAAGALADLLWPLYRSGRVSDSAVMARQLYHDAAPDLLKVMPLARNGRRLLANPDLRDDVPFCLQRDTLPIVAQLKQGAVRVLRAAER